MRNTLCVALMFVGCACTRTTDPGGSAGSPASSTAGSGGITAGGGAAGRSGTGGTVGAGGATGTGAPQDAAAGGAGGATRAGGASGGAGGATRAGGASGGTSAPAGGATGGGVAGAGGSGSSVGGRGGSGGSDAGSNPKDAGRDAGVDAASAPDSPSNVGRDAAADQSSVPGDAGSVSVPDGYVLAWSDEFDVDGAPNPKNWNFETGFARNQELQWYQSKNASVAGGMLIIEARRERVTNPNYSATGADWKTQRQYADYTSSSLTTSGLHAFTYGRFEMRARIDTSAGMWPAFWTVGATGEWPNGGEIDIMEFYKGNILANVAWGTTTRWVGAWDSSAKAVTSFGDPQWSSKFHVWRMDWDDKNIVLLVDDYQMNTTSLATAVNPDGTSPFKKDQYIIINLAIGGVNGGDPSGSTFPARYEIDYVRVFQKK